MNTADVQIVKFIKKIRRRMTEQEVMRYGGMGIIGGLVLAVIFSGIALFVPWYYAPLFALAAAVLGIVGGCVTGFVRRPDMKEAALGLDAHGFQERLITSYGLLGRDDTFSSMQKQDTVRRIGSFRVRETFPLKPRWQMLLTIFLLAGLFAGLSLIPTAAKERAADYQEVVKQVDAEVEAVDDAIEHIQKMDDISEEDKQELIGMLESAKDELREVSNEDELAKANERISVITSQEASKTELRKVREELQTLSDSISDREKTESEQLAEDLQDLQKDLQNLDDSTSAEDRQAIADQLQQLGQKTGNQTMQNAAQQVANNSISSEDLQQTQQAVANEQQNAQSGSQTASNQNNNSQNSSGQSSTEQNGSQSGQNSSESSGSQNSTSSQQGTQSTEASAQQSGSGNSGDTGSDGGSGEGGTNGQGQSGGQSGDGGQGGGYNQGSNQGVQGEGSSNGSMITIPNLGTQDNEALDGKVNTNGSSVTQKGGQAWTGDSVNYEQVIGSYSDRAYNKVENSNYPKGVQDVVKSYFDDLNKQ